MFGLQKKTDEKSPVASEVTYLPAVDVAETETGYTILADVPGAQKDSVQVTYEEGVVTLKAEGTTRSENAKAQMIHREFRAAAYERAFRVGEDVDAEKISAEISNGVLKVSLPKRASTKKTIAVSVK